MKLWNPNMLVGRTIPQKLSYGGSFSPSIEMLSLMVWRVSARINPQSAPPNFHRTRRPQTLRSDSSWPDVGCSGDLLEASLALGPRHPLAPEAFGNEDSKLQDLQLQGSGTLGPDLRGTSMFGVGWTSRAQSKFGSPCV